MAQNASQGRLGVITRRLFVGAIAGACVPARYLVLEAIAAERMPHRVILKGVAKSPYFEIRDYGGQNGKFLYSFESLAAREQAWREIGAVEASRGLREIAVYRCL